MPECKYIDSFNPLYQNTEKQDGQKKPQWLQVGQKERWHSALLAA